MYGFPLILAKGLIFNRLCLRNADLYFRLKGNIILIAARLGFYEFDYFETIRQWVKPGHETIDIGANFGAYTEYLSRLVGQGGMVYSFEPLPFVHFFLKNYFGSVKNVAVSETALSDVGGTLQISMPTLPFGVPEPALASLLPSETPYSHQVFQVPVACLDESIEQFKNLTFIKIDVEGNEMRVLKGAREVIRKFRPVIQLEADKINSDEIRCWGIEYNYQIWNLNQRKLSIAEKDSPFSTNIYLTPLA